METMKPHISSKELLINNAPVSILLSEGRTRPHVAFLGPRGSYTEEAKESLFGVTNTAIHEAPLKDKNEAVVKAVDTHKYDIGIVAAENSTEGDVTETIKALIRSKNLMILGETVTPIHHQLLGRSGETIDKILSHPQALGQSYSFLESNFPHAQKIETSSTSQAAEDILAMPNAAAIASRRVAELNGLSILAEDIGDNPHNATRFLVIGRGETEPTGNDITTLLFAPEADRPGLLRDILNIFAEQGINLTKIDSHPSGEMRKYVFMLSLDGHVKDARVTDALDELKHRDSGALRILGSYQKATVPEGVTEPGVWNGQ